MIKSQQEKAYNKKEYSIEEIKNIGLPTMFSIFIDDKLYFDENLGSVNFFDEFIENSYLDESFKLNITISECLLDFSELSPQSQLLIRTETLEEAKTEFYHYYKRQLEAYLDYLEKTLDKNNNKNHFIRFLNDKFGNNLTIEQLSEKYKDKINKTKTKINSLMQNFNQNKLSNSIDFIIKKDNLYVLPEILEQIVNQEYVYCVSLTNALFPLGFNKLIIKNIKFKYFTRYFSNDAENVFVTIDVSLGEREYKNSIMFNSSNRKHYIFTAHREEVVLFTEEDCAKEFTKKIAETLLSNI